MAFKNYYEILNLDEDCSLEDVKRSFRTQAKLYHPDVNNSENAAQKFRDVVEAFDVLSHEERRKAFDEMLENSKQGIPSVLEDVQRQQWEERSEERSEKYSRFPLEELLMLEILAETGMIDGLINGMGDIIDSAGDALDGLADLF